ncbi:MAG: translesion error-prone DNA polymerase V autoproteolytic subunit [Actinomycetaceae bacterium]|nr:translesion error-prone DNA polymerase V autoproteolytic subunit [Actinomycetaceae bacterium]
MRVAAVQRVCSSTFRARVPFALERVQAGFPSPAQDYCSADIDLHEHLMPNPDSTFILTVAGNSMIGAGIHDGDQVVVDRSIRPRDGHIVIAVIDNELTVKRLRLTQDGVVLQAENPIYPDLRVCSMDQFVIWGVVTWTLHPSCLS